MKLQWILVVLATSLAACRRDPVKFELRGFQTKSTDTEYSTSFTREGTVLVLGDTPAAKDPYAVLFEVKHLSGGDPDRLRYQPDPHYEVVFVNDGAGDYREFTGSRSKKTTYNPGDTWEQEKADVKPIGYIHFTPIGK